MTTTTATRRDNGRTGSSCCFISRASNKDKRGEGASSFEFIFIFKISKWCDRLLPYLFDSPLSAFYLLSTNMKGLLSAVIGAVLVAPFANALSKITRNGKYLYDSSGTRFFIKVSDHS